MNRHRFGLLLLLALSVQSCFMPRLPETPIPARFYEVGGREVDTLIIFLPGRGDAMDVFETEGFIDAMREFRVPADAVALDAHLGYYYSGQLAERIEADVLSPYQLKGYRSFILVGTSLGGYGSLWVRNEFPDRIESLVLIAPYLGPEEVVESVQRSESIGHWEASLDGEPTKDEFPWIWIRKLGESDGGLERHLTVAIGEEDRFRPGFEILAEQLPPNRVYRHPGGHDWSTWLELWRKLLHRAGEQSLLTQSDG